MGLQIDGNRFFGYMPVSAIVRLCRNIAKVEVKKGRQLLFFQEYIRSSSGKPHSRNPYGNQRNFS